MTAILFLRRSALIKLGRSRKSPSALMRTIKLSVNILRDERHWVNDIGQQIHLTKVTIQWCTEAVPAGSRSTLCQNSRWRFLCRSIGPGMKDRPRKDWFQVDYAPYGGLKGKKKKVQNNPHRWRHGRINKLPLQRERWSRRIEILRRCIRRGDSQRTPEVSTGFRWR